MTTIATDGFSLAGDGRSTNGDAISDKRRRKVFPLPDGSIIGLAGRTRDAERAARILMEGTGEDSKGDYTILQLTKRGKVVVYEGSLRDGIRVDAPYAIGSGWREALGALRAGADAQAAVRIASTIDVYTGGKITSYSR